MYSFLLLYTCFTYICIYTAVILFYWNLCIFILLLYCYFTRKRHLALVFKGLLGLKHSIVELRHIITSSKLLASLVVLSVSIYIRMLYSCMHTLKYLYVYMLHLCFTPAPPLLIYVTAVILLLLTYIHLYSCFPRTFLVLFLLCVCVPAYWPTGAAQANTRL